MKRFALSAIALSVLFAACSKLDTGPVTSPHKNSTLNDDSDATEKKKRVTDDDDDNSDDEEQTQSIVLDGGIATGPTGDDALDQGPGDPLLPPAGLDDAKALAIGCYRIEGGGYWSNGQGHSCAAPPTPFLEATCGTNDFSALKARQDHGANVVDGGCWLQKGCYRIAGGGYWSNGNGHSCVFLGERMPNHCNGMTTAQFLELPELQHHWGNALDAACAGSEAATAPQPQPVATGCYRVGSGGYWSNGQGHSCAVPPSPFLGSQCGTDDFNALTARSDHGTNVIDGGCWLRSGCYRIGGGGYWSNGQGHSCVFSGDRMAAHCGFGVDRFTELPSLTTHWGNVLDGVCSGS